MQMEAIQRTSGNRSQEAGNILMQKAICRLAGIEKDRMSII